MRASRFNIFFVRSGHTANLSVFNDIFCLRERGGSSFEHGLIVNIGSFALAKSPD